MKKIVVEYDHDPADFSSIQMRVGSGEWAHALRDTISERKVVWIRSDDDGEVRLKDRLGERDIPPGRVWRM